MRRLSLTLFLYLLPFLLLFFGFFQHIRAYNQDLGRHLLTGKLIIQTLHIPSTNLFSYTYPDFPFINHHWGAEVLFYLVHTLAGNVGLFILSILLILTAFSLVFFEAKKNASPFALVFLALIYIRILLDRTDIRPELFSFLYLSAMVTILYRYREKFTRLIFFLPIIELVWTNTHIYFPIGVLVTLLFCVDEVITKRKNLLSRHTKTLFLVFLLTGVVTLVNPHFLSGALYPLRVFQNYGYTIEENQNPFLLLSLGFPKPSFLYLEIAIAIFFITLLLSVKKSRPIDWLLLLVFSLIALNAVRNFPLFAFATFIPCVRALSLTIKPLLERIKTKPPVWKGLLYFSLIFFFIWQATPLIKHPSFGYGVDEDAKPALDFFQKEQLTGPIFNNFDIGSYIEARLYPKENVFIDGRPEAYPASFIQKTYIPMQENPSLFNEISDKYRFTAILFTHTDQTPWGEQFLRNILNNPQWITVYLDPTMIVLVKNIPQNDSVIKQFGKQKEQLTMDLSRATDRKLRSAAHFFYLATLPRQTESVLLKLLEIHPNDCRLLAPLVVLYAQTKNPLEVVYGNRYQTFCSQ